MKPTNTLLYEKVKEEINKIYKKPSAYRSGAYIRKYKELGGTFEDDNKEKPLKRWFKENWEDIGNLEYPVYRPTRRVSKKTPLLPSEIDPQNLKKQIIKKQVIKGKKNLPPFVKK
jgi:hypothetical protein